VKIPLQISSRKFTLTPRLANVIKEKARKLEQFYDDIIACRVMVETPHRHKNQGLLYNVRVDLTVPGDELVVKREPSEDVYVAVRDAFDAARRQLLTYRRRRRPDLKARKPNPEAASQDMGQIASLFSDQGFGYLTSFDGKQIYFSKSELLESDFENLEVGRLVRFTPIEEAGAELRASGITPV